MLNTASENFAIYYKTHCDDRCKSEVDTKDWSIMMRKRILEQISITNHVLVTYEAPNSFKIPICHLNIELRLILGGDNSILNS